MRDWSLQRIKVEVKNAARSYFSPFDPSVTNEGDFSFRKGFDNFEDLIDFLDDCNIDTDIIIEAENR